MSRNPDSEPSSGGQSFPIISNSTLHMGVHHHHSEGDDKSLDEDLEMLETENPALFDWLLADSPFYYDSDQRGDFIAGGLILYRALHKQAEANMMEGGNFSESSQPLLPIVLENSESILPFTRVDDSNFKKDVA